MGVLTQYKPLLLNSYIGIGSAWDLDNSQGGVYILPPFVGEQGGSWFKGTADAIYQNMDFINHYDPNYVLIISGDHIYKMDYRAMLQFHKEKQSDLTICVHQVSWEEASRYGIVTVDENDRIIKFTEKPLRADSNLASMGIYIFNWPILKAALYEDEADKESDNDFGKNVIPRLLRQGKGLYSHLFRGYWRDVGTIESYYEANMELLNGCAQLDIFDPKDRIFSNSDILPPHYIGSKAKVNNCLVSNGCTILGKIVNCIVAPEVYIAEEAKVEDSIILPKAKIMRGSWIRKAIIGERAQIGSFCSIGIKIRSNRRQTGITVIGDGSIIEQDSQIEEGESVCAGSVA